MSPACFKRLGISPNSSEREIKKAYRRLALATHPDKVAPAHREAATMQFREIHEAYEEALEEASCRPSSFYSSSSSSSSPSPSYSSYSNTKRTTSKYPRCPKAKKRTPFTDSDIRSAFQNVCDELDRETRARMDESRRLLVHLMETTWLRGGQEACLELCHGQRTCGLWELREVSEYFASSKPKLSVFLKNECDAISRASQQRKDEEIAQYAKRVNEQWPEHAEQLKSWANEVWWMSEYWYVAAKVSNPTAARAILEWKEERCTALHLKLARKYRAKAGQIIDSFPNVDKMHEILQEELTSSRREIYKLLPDEIRQALRKPSSWQTANAASTGPSPRRRSSTPARSKPEPTKQTAGPTMTHAIPRRRKTKPLTANQRSAPTGHTVQPAWHAPIPSRKKRVSTSTGSAIDKPHGLLSTTGSTMSHGDKTTHSISKTSANKPRSTLYRNVHRGSAVQPVWRQQLPKPCQPKLKLHSKHTADELVQDLMAIFG